MTDLRLSNKALILTCFGKKDCLSNSFLNSNERTDKSLEDRIRTISNSFKLLTLHLNQKTEEDKSLPILTINRKGTIHLNEDQIFVESANVSPNVFQLCSHRWHAKITFHWNKCFFIEFKMETPWRVSAILSAP